MQLAVRHPGTLLPVDPDARARAIMWMFAALSTIEPPVLEFTMALVFERDKPWYEARQPMLEARVRTRLKQLSDRLGSDEWLDGAFSAGDLLMISVLLRLASSGLVNDYANLAAYVARGEARPAYERAFAAQRAVFEASGA
jgi:glutathione S-transferase